MKTKLLFTVMSLIMAFALTAQEARYEIKSGIIKRTMDMMGQKSESILYFDNYGKVEASTMNFMGGSMLQITKGDTMIFVNQAERQANRMIMQQKPVNYTNLTQEVKDRSKIKELGDETVAGKPCKKYSLEMNQMGQTTQATVWVWKGIVLKQSISFEGMEMITEATEVQENVAIPADKISVPSGITVQEMQRPF